MNPNCREIRKRELQSLKEQLLSQQTKLGLAVMQIGDDPASSVYIKQKAKMCAELGYSFTHIKLPTTTTNEEVLALIDCLNNDESINGILVQMPIPNHLDQHLIQNRIHPSKDVDGLTDVNAGMLIHNRECLTPCTPQGIMTLLDDARVDLEGKNVVIVGRSDLVGKPLACMMTNRNATVILCHSKTKNLRSHTNSADILVVAVGKANMIKADDVKVGAVVIDVGINRLPDGSLCGDVDYDDVKDKALYVTPVPGGVGQMTICELGKNVYKAKKLIKG